MRVSRRSVLFGAGAALGAAGYAFAGRPSAVTAPTPVDVLALQVPDFSVTEPGRRRFGALTFRSGLELRASFDGFGGFSGLWRSADGRDLVALADNAQWLTGRLEMRDGRLVGLSDTAMAPLLGRDGALLRGSRHYDTEGLALGAGAAYVSVERDHALLRFGWEQDRARARGRPVELPREVRLLPGNRGLEAIAMAPPASPLAGALVAVAERSNLGDATPTRGFILTGPQRGAFRVARSDGYDVTDLVFLPSGDALLLERRFSFLDGLSARLRRLASDAIRPGAVADGPMVYRSEASHQIDNMEGLALHRDGSETVLTMISDDNFSRFQRTLLLEFALAE